MSSKMLSLLRNRALRTQIAFALAKVVAPIGLVAALLVAGAPRQEAPVAAFRTPVSASGTSVASTGVPDAVRLP